MSGRYLVCTAWNDSASTCDAQAWVVVPSWVDWMPTIDDATTIGTAFLFGWLTVAAVKHFLKPRKDPL
jgi:hypothetical protein